MDVKRIVGMAKNEDNYVVAEVDNGIYIWVPTRNNMTGENIIITDDNINLYNQNAYAASWLFWDKWVDIMANGEIPQDMLGLVLNNIYTVLEKSPPGEDYLGSRLDKETLDELKSEEKEMEEWCKENPHAYDVSGYDVLLDDIYVDEDEDEE